MNKHRTHQIDDLAQRFLRDALPPTWVPNEQHRDYGKDYLVEIGEDNGDLTGSSFYVQLKGQEKMLEWRGPFDPSVFDARQATKEMRKGKP